MKLRKRIFVSVLYALSVTPVFAATVSKPTLFPDQNNWWHDRVTMSGGVNVAAFFSDETPTTYGVMPSSVASNPAASDLNISYAKLQADAKLSDWLSTTWALTYSRPSPSFIRSAVGNGTLYIDQAYVKVANPEKTPFYLSAGQQGIPFGGVDYTSVLESTYQLLTNNREIMLAVGFADLHGFNASAYTFHSRLNKVGEGNTTKLDNGGLTLGYGQHDQSAGFDVGADYISNLLTSLYPFSTTANSSTLGGGVGIFHTAVPAIDLHATGHMNAFDASIKFASAIDHASVLDVPFTTNGSTLRGAKPAAWGVDGGYSFTSFSHKSRVSAGYQGSSEAAALGTASGSVANSTSGVYGTSYAIGMPEARYYADYSITLIKWATLFFECAHDVGYGTQNGGTGRASNTGVVMLAATF